VSFFKANVLQPNFSLIKLKVKKLSERIRPSSIFSWVYVPRKVRKPVNFIVYEKEYFLAFFCITLGTFGAGLVW
jgi:hypothetical protein